MAFPLPAPGPKEIEGYIRTLLKWLKNRRWGGIQDALVSSRKDPNLYRFLKWLYPSEDIPVCGDSWYPISMYHCPPVQQANPESLLLPLDAPAEGPYGEGRVDQVLKDAGARYRSLQTQMGVVMHQTPSFALKELTRSKDGELRLSCTLGNYFDWVDTCNILEIELLTKFSEARPTPADFPEFWNSLLLRRRAHVLGVPWKPAGRCAALGLTTVIAYRDDERLKTILRERSKAVALEPHTLAVVPAGMFEPATDTLPEEYSIRHNFYKEYAEELFAMPEADRAGPQIAWDRIYGEPNVRYLRELEANGHARFLATGVVLSLLNLSFDICTLLLVETPEWRRIHGSGDPHRGLSSFKTNFEFKTVEELRQEGKTATWEFSLDKEFLPSELSPAAGGALLLARDSLRSEGILPRAP